MRNGWVLIGLALAFPAAAQVRVPAQAETESPYVMSEAMIPMRDGARMHTVILTPRGATGPLPILFSRTPYGVPAAPPKSVPRSWAALARDGYILVNQSMRGRFKSDGVFTLSTAVHPNDPKAVDESTDAYDSIDWLVKNVPGNSGKVGMTGISYPGFAAAVALVNPHPALKAVSPQAAWIDYWVNDDLHRYGALRLSYATDWLHLLQKTKENSEFDHGEADIYDWFLRQGPVENIDRLHFQGAIPMFTSLLNHPNHDSFYKRQRWSDALGRTTVPTLNVTGYWDQEDPWGSWAIHRKQQADDPKNLSVMVAGPWSHGYWSRPDADNLGRINYGVRSGEQFLEQVQAPFFAYWLHGRGAKPDYEVKSFQSGSWTWRSYARWPVPAAMTDLYLRVDGTLSFAKPKAGEGCRAYISDPADPVPFSPRPIKPTFADGDHWQWWEAEDQRFLSGRPDVLSWVSAPLERDLTVTGEVMGRLRASTSGTDSDFVVKLIDVFPDDYQAADGARLGGYQLPVAMEIRRGKFLASGEKPRALRPGIIVSWAVPLRERDHVFRRGHRLMVQVQSSWFPMIDRNPQRFVPNIARARPGDFVKATQRVCAGSKIVLPVVR